MYLLLFTGSLCCLGTSTEISSHPCSIKANSPSCGSKLIYDGSFTGNKIQGDGVTAALFKQHDIEVMTEDEFYR